MSAPKAQADKFRDLVLELGADEAEARFEEAVKKFVQAPKADKAGEEDE